MNERYIPDPGERHIAVRTELCKPDCDCVPSRMCPVGAIHREPGRPARVDHAVCLLCGGCVHACKPGALSIQR